MRRGLFALFLLLFSTIVAACSSRTHSHDVGARPLELPHEPATQPAPAAQGSAFAVVFAAPKGDAVDPVEVTILFNRPMRPLEIAGEETSPPATLRAQGTEKTPAGSWRWMGTSALIFAPKSHLPNATEYTIAVPAGTRALTGEVLAAPFETTFSTPRPKLEELHSTGHDDYHASPRDTFDARFNQIIDLRELERATKLVAGEAEGTGAKIGLRASYPDRADHRIARLIPTSPLPLGKTLSFTFDASLRGIDGPLPMTDGEQRTLSTYGSLKVVDVTCSQTPDHRCQPGGTFSVALSNQVPLTGLKAHVRAVPTPPLRWSEGAFDDQETSEEFVLPARPRPGTTFSVTITAGLADIYGQTLARDAVFQLAVGDLDPAVVIGLAGAVIEAGSSASHVVPVTAVNTPSYRLAYGSLEERQVAQLVEERDEKADPPLSLLEHWSSVHVDTVNPVAPRNVGDTKEIPIEALLGDRGGRGAVVIAASTGDRNEMRVASLTDLAVTAKMSRFGSLVWVTHLSDGAPVPGADVAIVDAAGTVAEARADADGVATIGAAKYSPADEVGTIDRRRIVVARVGSDWTWRRVADVFRWGGDGVWIDPSGGLDPLGMLFTDRGVYRPGETAHVQTIFRLPTPRGTDTPAGRAVNVTAVDAEGETIFTGEARLDAYGAATLDMPLPSTAHLGETALTANIVGWQRGAQASVQLAAYKASEFKASVEPGEPTATQGDDARFTVHGDYLFGAPMAGAKVRWTATRSVSSFEPPANGGFVFDNEASRGDLPDATPRGGQFRSGEGKLDGKGALSAHVPLALPGQTGTEAVTLEAEVQDISRQTVSARAAVLVHPASFYVGLRGPDDPFVRKGDTLRVDVVAVDPSGARRPAAVHVDLLRRTWSSVLESMGEGRGHWTSRTVDTRVSACDVTTGGEPASCPLATAQPGFYVVRAQAHDEKGRITASSLTLYVVGAGGDAAWAENDASTISVVGDKKAYDVGDVARFLVKSPLPEADALVTIERAGIYRTERAHLVGATPTVTIPVTEDLRPNAFVSVHLIRGRTKAAPASGADVGAPVFKSGYAELVVEPESRRLAVDLTPAKKDLQPGETFEADVVVNDHAGKPAQSELTLWAVDEGVLMLTRYETPDPLPTFTAPRPLAVFGLESRADLAHTFRWSPGEMGIDKGDQGGGGGGLRADFRATAWFQAGVLTGEDGRAHVRFKLPDNLTTLRVMAVAVSRDDRFGSGQTDVTVSRPMMLRPALPRFLRAGDAIDAGVVVSTKGLGDQKVEVTLSAKGLSVEGPAQRVIDVKAGQSVEVRWPMRAEHPGAAQLKFVAHGGGASDAVQVDERIDLPAAIETVALAGQTDGTAVEKVGSLENARDDTGALEVSVASTALVGAADGMNQLLQYPYGCTEQLVSRLVPLVAARGLAEALGIGLTQDPDALADGAISKILANQRSDGGFGWWSDSPKSSRWMTAYALWGLHTAAAAGRPVPKEALENATTWLRSILASVDPAERAGDSEAAFIVDVLAENGEPDPGQVDRLYERRAALDLYARALLAHAAALSKTDARATADLVRDLETHLRITPTSASVVEAPDGQRAPELVSNAVATAMVLRALLAASPKHPLTARLARGLLGERHDGQWRTTHEAAWALLALDDYRRIAEDRPTAFDAHVTMSGTPLLEASFQTRSTLQRSVEVPTAKLLGLAPPELSFAVDGSGELFYEARLRYARKELPHDAIERGLFVEKHLRVMEPGDLGMRSSGAPAESPSRVAAGKLVLVDLDVSSMSPREQVVIDDPLPAGLEPVDTALATSGSSDEAAAEEPSDPDREDEIMPNLAIYYGADQPWAHREMHDERVLMFLEQVPAGVFHYRYVARATTLGRFVVPPTKAECMYDPGVFGRTAASTFEVIAP